MMTHLSASDSRCRVAFLGPRGTFTEQALREFMAAGHVPPAAETVEVAAPGVALKMVREGQADFACVALESSVDGPVAQTEDALAAGERLQIYHEVIVPVAFTIMVRQGMAPEDARTITTHPVAEAQVTQWIAEHLPHVTFVPASSNGAAAQMVAEGRADVAAAPERAREIHDLEALAKNVADVPGAHTRFVLVGKPGAPTPRTGNDRTGVAFVLENQPSSLLDALTQLSGRGVDMSRISSRPLRGALEAANSSGSFGAPGITEAMGALGATTVTAGESLPMAGHYVFHVGVVGHIDDAAVAEALAGLHRVARHVRYLGSWPASEDVKNRHQGSAPPSFTESVTWVDRLKQGED
ncbi:prephenate dehydratase [Corynebacterium auriscanis]